MMTSSMRAALAGLLGLVAGCGSSDLVASGVLGKDESCGYTADTSYADAPRKYDMAAADARIAGCETSYIAHLLVSNDNGETAIVESSLVRLMTTDRHTIRFDAGRTPLPNPFLVPVGSPVASQDVVPVEAIPAIYGAQLTGFVDIDILIEVELKADVGGSEIGSNRLVFPVEICDGCFTFCASDPDAPSEACEGVQREGEICIEDAC
jgi:hypothetical protein